MNLKSLLKRIILEQDSNCKSCQGKKPRLNEVDWDKFSDMLPEDSCLSNDEVVAFLNRTKERMGRDKGVTRWMGRIMELVESSRFGGNRK